VYLSLFLISTRRIRLCSCFASWAFFLSSGSLSPRGGCGPIFSALPPARHQIASPLLLSTQGYELCTRFLYFLLELLLGLSVHPRHDIHPPHIRPMPCHQIIITQLWHDNHSIHMCVPAPVTLLVVVHFCYCTSALAGLRCVVPY
jgi:hypothetical protein